MKRELDFPEERRVSKRFDEFWLSGLWRKIGKESARGLFEKSVRTEKDWTDIQAARDSYNEYCELNKKWHQPVLGSVWFGSRKGWRHWIPDEVEAIVDDPLPVVVEGKHVHRCSICDPPHYWVHDDDWCFIDHDVICEKAFAEMKERQKVKK